MATLGFLAIVSAFSARRIHSTRRFPVSVIHSILARRREILILNRFHRCDGLSSAMRAVSISTVVTITIDVFDTRSRSGPIGFCPRRRYCFQRLRCYGLVQLALRASYRATWSFIIAAGGYFLASSVTNDPANLRRALASKAE